MAQVLQGRATHCGIQVQHAATGEGQAGLAYHIAMGFTYLIGSLMVDSSMAGKRKGRGRLLSRLYCSKV